MPTITPKSPDELIAELERTICRNCTDFRDYPHDDFTLQERKEWYRASLLSLLAYIGGQMKKNSDFVLDENDPEMGVRDLSEALDYNEEVIRQEMQKIEEGK